MLLNADLDAPTMVDAARLDWVASPSPGVHRKMLFRVGGEKARATSIVRYAPGTSFPRHQHPGGEEFFVLEGTFQDEAGDFPEGSYVRNPPGTGHAPGSVEGCIIFVKLWQFRDDDLERVARLPASGAAWTKELATTAVILFESAQEQVRLDMWAPHADIWLDNACGLEVLVLSGAVSTPKNRLGRWSWLRLPAGSVLHGRAGPDGARLWVKAAPLLHDRVCRI